MICELRLGKWQDGMNDVVADSIITDAPFSERTHKGYKTNDDEQQLIAYPPITRADAYEFAASWRARVRGWVVIFGDHVSFAWHEEAWQSFGFTTFAPVGWVLRNPSPRKHNAGPSTSVCHILVARKDPCEWEGVSRARPGHYLVNVARDYPGGKDLDGMKAIVQHYSRPGDVVVDPYAGRATTLIAARDTGRGAIGSEVIATTYADAMLRLNHGTSVMRASARGQVPLL